MPIGLITVIDRRIWRLNQALALGADSDESRRDLDACERIRTSLLLAVAEFQPRRRRPLGWLKSRSAKHQRSTSKRSRLARRAAKGLRDEGP